MGDEQTVVLEGEVQSPTVKDQMFKDLDAALAYCRFVKPDELAIKRIFNGVEAIGWQLHFTGSEGMR
jgi:hypothetical protein